MSSYLYAFESWQVNGGAVLSYNNDTGLWSSTPASDPNIVAGVANNAGYTYKGAWDGNSWYIISPSGGLHAYTPASNTWKSLVSGAVIIQGQVINNLQSAMASDGAFVYHLSNTNDFRRYDPSLDMLTALAAPLGGSYGTGIFLVYDGSGSIYGTKGGANAVVGQYNIASNTWAALPSGSYTALLSANYSWTAFLQGSLWLIINNQNSPYSLLPFSYNPTSGMWASGAVQTGVTVQAPSWPGGEDSDSSIRIWPSGSQGSYVYNIVSNSWSQGAASNYTWAEGTSWCVSRAFSAAYTWYQPDGVTLLPATVDMGTAVTNQQITYHARVKTPVGRANGVTVSVRVNTSTDAEDPVRICQTLSGTYTTSFATGALNPGDEFDVYMKFAPTAQQTLGLAKRFVLEISSN